MREYAKPGNKEIRRWHCYRARQRLEFFRGAADISFQEEHSSAEECDEILIRVIIPPVNGASDERATVIVRGTYGWNPQ